MSPLNFAMTGAAGFIAPRHMKAIFDLGHRLVAAVDPHDSVGVLDQYFFHVKFFTEVERFDRHLEKLRRSRPDQKVDYLAVCSPNYLHDAHCRLGLRVGADVICEKPLVVKPWNLDPLAEIEAESGKRIYTVLQLRHHPKICELRQELQQTQSSQQHEVELTYIASRGDWYQFSWKGDMEKSGGVVMNIGIHFFDMLIWIFGSVQGIQVHHFDPQRASGYLELERAKVKWFLSVSPDDLPQGAIKDGKYTFRNIIIDGKEIEFSDGFTGLHTEVYRAITSGKGDGIQEARPSIELVHQINNAQLSPKGVQSHSYIK